MQSNNPPLLRLLLDNKRHWLGLIVMLMLIVPSGIFKTLTATLWGQAVDLGVDGYVTEMLVSAIWMLIFIGMDALRTIILYVLVGQVTEGMFADVRAYIFKALHLTDTKSSNVHLGDIALRSCEDVDVLCEIIANDQTNFARLIFQASFAIVACFILSWQLSIAFLILLPVSLWLLNWVSTSLEETIAKNRGDASLSANVASGTLLGIDVVKLFGMEFEMTKRFTFHINESFVHFKRASRVGIGLTIIRYVVSILQTFSLFIIGVWFVNMGVVTIGTVIAFIALAFWVTEAFGNVDWMIYSTKSAFAVSKRIYEVIDLPKEPSGEEMALECSEYINFNNVDFRYDENSGKRVLSGLNIVVNEGQKVAIIGESGSGKSTIISLICHLYENDSGNITLFGRENKRINLNSLRNNIALVTQEPSLFEDSILNNVRYSRTEASEDEVIDVLKAVDLWDFISMMPNGIYTRLGEFGTRLSGGQRQRLSIARALLKRAKLVLLDEATSALDTRTEREIQKSLDKLLEGRSAVIVAHRLTTVLNADYIYCLGDGAVIEEGTRDTLYAKGGYFYEMCRSQGVAL